MKMCLYLCENQWKFVDLWMSLNVHMISDPVKMDRGIDLKKLDYRLFRPSSFKYTKDALSLASAKKHP